MGQVVPVTVASSDVSGNSFGLFLFVWLDQRDSESVGFSRAIFFVSLKESELIPASTELVWLGLLTSLRETISTDASRQGWGAVLDLHYLSGLGSRTESQLHLNLIGIDSVGQFHSGALHFSPGRDSFLSLCQLALDLLRWFR